MLADEPALSDALRAAGWRFDAVQLALDADLAVRVEGSAWHRLIGGGARVVHAGLFALDALELDGLAAEGARQLLAPARRFFARNAWSCATSLRRVGLPCTDLVADLTAMQAVLPPLLREAAPPERPASALLRDPREASRALTAAYVAKVDAYIASLGQDVPPLAAHDGAERAYAEGLALHDAAADLAQRKLDAANQLAIDALARLESAVGADHPSLVTALANAARAHARLGDAAAARPLLDRALDLHRRDPSADENETLRLQTLLDRL